MAQATPLFSEHWDSIRLHKFNIAHRQFWNDLFGQPSGVQSCCKLLQTAIWGGGGVVLTGTFLLLWGCDHCLVSSSLENGG